MSPAHRRRKLLIWLILFVLFFAGGHALRMQRFASADHGFHAVTGRDLPANVQAMAHASEITDNFFHESHLWLLQGPAASLHELAPAPAFARSDEDAAGWIDDVSRRLGLADARMIEGYEGSTDGGRDRWLLILQPGDRAVFVY